jgi:tripartite-type tricarboxylate transporter receptor subunit TctC
MLWGDAMKLPRRKFLRLAASAAALPLVSHVARAQAYPTRPVRIVVGWPAGGTTDIATHLIAQWLSERLGQPFVIENRPGAASNIATEAVVRAPADGYTLLAVTATNTVNATLYDKLSFNFVRDRATIAGILRSPLVLEVNPAVSASAVPEFITYVKANAGKVSLASFGTGTTSHVAGELFKMMAGVRMPHVPYRGSAPMVSDLLGGQVPAAFDNLPASIASIRAGKLRPLAVTTAMRAETLPNIPTQSEFLPGFEASAWNAIGVPTGTPAAIVDKLNKEINSALSNPKIKARIANHGATVLAGSPAEVGDLIAAETEKWRKVIRAADLKPE